ncbi:MAG TPA: sugar ABC transporter permease [Acidimicrobiia bacterium]|jgi:alpha-glucoside transport system permease protein
MSRAVEGRTRRARDLTTALAGLVALGLAFAGGYLFLKADAGPERLMTWLYRRIGLEGQADAIASRGFDPLAAKLMVAVVAMLLGVGGIWGVYLATNRLVDQFPDRTARALRPWVFVGPAVVMLGFYLVFPAVGTLVRALKDDGGVIENLKFVFTEPDVLSAWRNNVLWIVVGTAGSVLIGLAFATLVDRVKREALAKTFVFLPLAISMVGAAVIWRFVYYWRPAGEEQIGLLNGVFAALGREPTPFLQTPVLNTLSLIVVMIWLQTGFAMVVLSAAIKAVPTELLEAARIDGASEPQTFMRVVLPSIRGAVLTVATTILIAILKVFDIVFVTTGGRFDSDVIANRMFQEMIRFRNFGRASMLAVALLLVVVPVMVINVRNLRKQGIGA